MNPETPNPEQPVPPQAVQPPVAPPAPVGAPQPQGGTDTLAVVGLVLAIIFPLVGFIISLIALSNIKKNGHQGKGLALAGTIVGGILTALGILWILMVFVFAGAAIHEGNKAVNDLNKQLTATTSTGTQETIKVGKSTPTAYDGTLTISDVVRNFPYKTIDGLNGDEALLVNVAGSTTSTDFTSPPTVLSMYVKTDDGKENGPSLFVSDSELKAAGFTPYDGLEKMTPSSPVKGYVAFAIPKGSKHATFVYDEIGGEKVSIELF